jgi:CRISPR-associated protein Csd1
MLLRELTRLASTSELAEALAPAAYAHRRVRQVIELDGSGRLLQVLDLQGSGNAGARGELLLMPTMVRTSAIRPILLADGPDYVFGIGENQPKAERRHEAFMRELVECAKTTGMAEVRAVLGYLEKQVIPDNLDPSADIVTFRVEGRFVAQLPEFMRYWQSKHGEEQDTSPGQCMICGRSAPVTDVWPVLIKGIPGGQTSGNQLASANADAFESYGMKGSRTSPACLDCSTAAGKALNWLLAQEHHRVFSPRSVFVFWTVGDDTFDFAAMLSADRPEQIHSLLLSAHRGQESATQLEASRFYGAELGASGARVVVRDWIDTTIPAAQRHLARYFHLQAITMPDGTAGHPIPLSHLALATAREWRGMQPDVLHDLLGVALRGRPAPPRLLAATLRRVRAEQRLTRPQAALIKLVLASDPNHPANQEDSMQSLDPSLRTPAYLCGRLLAELQAAQLAALGRGIKSTLTSRYLGAASASPATVFPTLLRTHNAHMDKLRKNRYGTYLAIERRVTEILGNLPVFPAVLTLKQQGEFQLGMYHQKAFDANAAREARERRDDAAKDLAAAVETEGGPE